MTFLKKKVKSFYWFLFAYIDTLKERKGEMLDLFILSMTLGIFMLTVEGILNNISGWIIILFAFSLMLNPAKLYKEKVFSPALTVVFFLGWFMAINLGTLFFLSLLSRVGSSGAVPETKEILFSGTIFVVLLVVSICLFPKRLLETAAAKRLPF